MPAKTSGLVIAALFASAAFAQPGADRVLHFTHGESDRVLQETATDLRGITEIEGSVDTTERTVTLHGTAAQIALAEWLVKQWEKSAPAPHEYRLSSDDIVRVFYAAHAPTPQVLQELATVLRTISNVHRIFTYDLPNVITARGDASQIALAEWLVNQLDQPAHAAAHEFHPSGAADDVARVFFVTHAESPRSVQEIATVLRAITEVKRAFTYESQAIAARGTAAQIALAEWLLNELDQPADQPSRTAPPHEFRPSGDADDVVAVFFLTHSDSPERLQEIATEVRSATEVKRLFLYNAPHAMTARGTAAQIALAGRLIAEQDK